MNNGALSNIGSLLNTKFHDASHFLHLSPFNESKFESLANSILSENEKD
jgi:hypothetical protein